MSTPPAIWPRPAGWPRGRWPPSLEGDRNPPVFGPKTHLVMLECSKVSQRDGVGSRLGQGRHRRGTRGHAEFKAVSGRRMSILGANWRYGCSGYGGAGFRPGSFYHLGTEEQKKWEGGPSCRTRLGSPWCSLSRMVRCGVARRTSVQQADGPWSTARSVRFYYPGDSTRSRTSSTCWLAPGGRRSGTKGACRCTAPKFLFDVKTMNPVSNACSSPTFEQDGPPASGDL